MYRAKIPLKLNIIVAKEDCVDGLRRHSRPCVVATPGCVLGIKMRQRKSLTGTDNYEGTYFTDNNAGTSPLFPVTKQHSGNYPTIAKLADCCQYFQKSTFVVCVYVRKNN